MVYLYITLIAWILPMILVSRTGLLINLIPLISFFSLIVVAYDFVSELFSEETPYGQFIANIKERRAQKRMAKEERIRALKEREMKIKKGIIRITPNDPYGEENWETN